MPALTADPTTLAAIFAESTDDAKRAAIDTRLGDGTLTFELTNGASILTGTFSGSLWGAAVLAVDQVALAGKTGAGGVPTSDYYIKIIGAGGSYVEFPYGAFVFTGPNGSATVSAGDEIEVTIRFGDVLLPFTWRNTYFTDDKRPDFSNPTTTLTIDDQATLDTYLASYSELPPGDPVPISPAGDAYLVFQSGDYLDLVLDATALTINTPIKLLNWRNVWVVGGEWLMITPPGGGVGELSNVASNGDRIQYANLYPRPVGGSMLQISATHTTLIEGVDMDIAGHNCDAIIVNSVTGRTVEQDYADKNIYLINSNIRGYRGHLPNQVDGGPGGGPLGDCPHADVIQMQSESGSYNEFIAENVVLGSGHEGFVMNCVGKQPARAVFNKCMVYWDERYLDPNPAHRQLIAPLAANAESVLVKEVHIPKTQIWGGSSVVTNENHYLFYAVGPNSKVLYFTDGYGTYGNAGDGDANTPVASGSELDMTTWEPVPYNPASYTSVVRHEGLRTWGGTLAAGDQGSPPAGTDFAPLAYVGSNYDKGGSYEPPVEPPTGPQYETINSVATIISDMTGNNDGVIEGVAQANDNTFRWMDNPNPAQIAMGAPKGSAAPDWWHDNPAYDASIKDGDYWNAITAWMFGFETPNHSATNAAIETRNHELWYIDKVTGKWALIGSSAGSIWYPFNKKPFGYNNGVISTKAGENNTTVALFPTNQTVLPHGEWSPKRIDIGNIVARVGAVWHTYQARYRLWDVNGVDDIEDAEILLQTGADYYPETTHEFGQTPNPGLGLSRSKVLTRDWQAFNFMTLELDPSRMDTRDESGVITQAQLTANPPPFTETQVDDGGIVYSVSPLGEYTTPSPLYTPSTPPANAVRTLMAPTDAPYIIGRMGVGWHQWGTVSNPGFAVLSQRLHDDRAVDNLDDGGMFTGRICRAGRHQYDKARFDERAQANNSCPKFLPIYMFAKWQVSAAHIQDIQNRYGPENQYNQIHGVTRYPSFPYGAHPVENLEYIREYIRWVYRPVAELGPGGEPGAGYTKATFPIIEYGNEQKFAGISVNDGRWWDNPYAPNNQGQGGPQAFNLQTMQEFAAGVRACKEAAPAGVLVAVGGWEGNSQGRTLDDPSWDLSMFQAWALSDDLAGGIGIDHIDLLLIHPYLFGYDPRRCQTEIDGYRGQLAWLAEHLGRPELNDMPIHMNETGHENGAGELDGFGSGGYAIDNTGNGYETLGRNLLRTTLIMAGNASRNKVVGITHYQDIPYATANGDPKGRQTYGAPSENALLSSKAQEANQAVGRVVRQAYEYSDGTIWVEFEDQLIMTA
ncbi:MAG: hypothetical protein ACRBC3_19700 [Burkholderiaceae bacterium]